MTALGNSPEFSALLSHSADTLESQTPDKRKGSFPANRPFGLSS